MTYRPYPNADRALRQLRRHPQPEPAVRLAHWIPEPPGAAEHRERFQEILAESGAALQRSCDQLRKARAGDVRRGATAFRALADAARRATPAR